MSKYSIIYPCMSIEVFILNNKTVIGPTGYIFHILEDKEVASLLPGYTWVDGPIDDEDE